MTPEELDAIERDYEAYGYAYIGSSVPDLIAALREAWAEADRLVDDLLDSEHTVARVRALCEPPYETTYGRLNIVSKALVRAAIERDE